MTLTRLHITETLLRKCLALVDGYLFRILSQNDGSELDRTVGSFERQGAKTRFKGQIIFPHEYLLDRFIPDSCQFCLHLLQGLAALSSQVTEGNQGKLRFEQLLRDRQKVLRVFHKFE